MNIEMEFVLGTPVSGLAQRAITPVTGLAQRTPGKSLPPYLRQVDHERDEPDIELLKKILGALERMEP